MNRINNLITDLFSQYCREASKELCVDEEKIVNFTNKFWNIKCNNLTILPLDFKKILSRGSTPLNSDRDRDSARGNGSARSKKSKKKNGSVSEASDVSDDEKSSKKKVSKEEKKNTCNYLFKMGVNKGKMCGIACVEERCSRHKEDEKSTSNTTSSSSTTSSSTTNVSKDDKKTRRAMQTKLPFSEKLQKIVDTHREHFPVVKNNYNRYVHEATGLLYDPKTQMVYGVQSNDGKVLQLSVNDIELCKSLNIDYKFPDNLGASVRDLDVNTEDFDDVEGEEDDVEYEDIKD